MKRFLILLAALVFPLAAGAQTFTANLSGAAEVAGGAPAGMGVAVVTFDGSQVTYTILVSGIETPSAAHIHEGAAGTDGNVVVNFQPVFMNGTAAGTVPADPGVVSQILANPSGFYVNVHTATFPNGAVRGQLGSALVVSGDEVSYLPIVGKTPGQGGTFFVTDVRMVNNSGGTATVNVEFFPLSQGGVSAPSAIANIVIAPNEQAVVNDVAEALGVSGLGAVRVSSDAPVLTIARIINDQRPNDAGTSGFAVEAQSLAEVNTAGVLPFLSASTDFRTNVGYFNPLPTPVTLTLTARDTETGGILGSNTIAVGAFGGIPPQGVFNVISNVPQGARVRDDFYVTWSSSAPILVWASVTDNVTGDGVFVQ